MAKWSEMDIEQRVNVAIDAHQEMVKYLTNGKGMTHELMSSEYQLWLVCQGHEIAISTLRALLYD
jgi:hypothetical protein